jgi:hypothetical protein
MKNLTLMCVVVGACFSYCFAEKNSMEYFYKYRCNDTRPDFAALAVLEKQSCPPGFDDQLRSKNGKLPTCASRCRIISVLDATSGTPIKEYLDVENYPVSSDYLHRPILVFGKYENGKIKIEEYEETREYFDPFNISIAIENQGADNNKGGYLSLLAARSSDIYALHSIGTPYYPKNLDTHDSIYYKKYLIPEIKRYVENAGKDFNNLWQRLVSNRTPIKAINVKNDFAALGVICGVRPARDASKKRFYELNVAVETVFKNNANIDSSITIYIDRKRLQPVRASCLSSLSLETTPFYLFGDIKDGHLIIDSLGSTRDMFVFGDTVYDIAMGLPFKELLTYFLPSNISFEELEFGNFWEINIYIFKEEGYITSTPPPNCREKAIMEMADKWVDFFKNKRKHPDKRPYMASVFRKFRCRGSVDSWESPPSLMCNLSQRRKKTNVIDVVDSFMRNGDYGGSRIDVYCAANEWKHFKCIKPIE